MKDVESWPAFLQQKFDEMDLDFNVQVINAGIPKAFSEGEVKLIKNRLLQYQPDLFVVYDGWNDSAFHQDGITNEDKWFDGIANFGYRPTVDGKKLLLEAHLFDFNQNIYGKELTVEFLTFIREEKKFDNFALLTKQIQKDIQLVKTYHSTQ